MDWTKVYSRNFKNIGHSDVAEILKLAEQPEVISFAGGLPDPETFLLEEIKEATNEVYANVRSPILGYGPVPGVKRYREWLAERMTRQGRPTEMSECIATTGGIAAFDLICKILLDPGDVVVVGEPSYLAVLHVVRSYEGRFVGAALDSDGMNPDALEAKLRELQKAGKRPKFIYTVPSFQNPAGVTMSTERRQKIIAVAREFNVPIVEDAAYRDLRFSGEAPPLLAALDPENVIHINTFSKIFNPGIRLGWLTAPRDFTNAVVLAKQGQDQCSSTLGQYLIPAFDEKGLLEKQIENAKSVYRKKCGVMLETMAQTFPQNATWTQPEGGFYTWATFPETTDTEALLPRAIEETSVAYVSGSTFYHDRSVKNKMRICYSFVSEEKIKTGITRLGELLRSVADKADA